MRSRELGEGSSDMVHSLAAGKYDGCFQCDGLTPEDSRGSRDNRDNRGNIAKRKVVWRSSWPSWKVASELDVNHHRHHHHQQHRTSSIYLSLVGLPLASTPSPWPLLIDRVHQAIVLVVAGTSQKLAGIMD
ncbi:hypothetical protein J3459_007683 [Metarhizium acridum]|nr:hypothetical protein J3459_007683 [Metarhizium acridum]